MKYMTVWQPLAASLGLMGSKGGIDASILHTFVTGLPSCLAFSSSSASRDSYC